MQKLNDTELVQDISHNIGILFKRLADYELVCDLFLDEDVRFKVMLVFNSVADIFMQKNISKLNLPEEYLLEKWRGLRLMREIVSLDNRAKVNVTVINEEIRYHKNADPKYMD